MLTGTGSRYVLNQVALPIISEYWCARQDWYGNEFIHRLTFCAGYYGGGMDACSVRQYDLNISWIFTAQARLLTSCQPTLPAALFLG